MEQKSLIDHLYNYKKRGIFMKMINRGMLLLALLLVSISALQASASKLNFQLTNSILPAFTPNAGPNLFQFVEYLAKLSPDGSLATTGNLQFGGALSNDAVTFYTNTNGTLSRTGGIKVSDVVAAFTSPLAPYTDVVTVAVSNDLSLCLIGSSNYYSSGGSTSADGLLTLWSIDVAAGTFALIATYELTDYLPASGSMNLTNYSFTSDNSYAAIVYVNNAPLPPQLVTARLAVFKTASLSAGPVAFTDNISGFSDGAAFFNLCKHGKVSTYLALGASTLFAEVKLYINYIHTTSKLLYLWF